MRRESTASRECKRRCLGASLREPEEPFVDEIETERARICVRIEEKVEFELERLSRREFARKAVARARFVVVRRVQWGAPKRDAHPASGAWAM